jgi:hypothetical protein
MIILKKIQDTVLPLWNWLLDPPSAWIDWLIRAGALAIFAVSVYFGALIPDMRNNMFMQINTGEVDLAVQTIAASNAGRPFTLLDPSLRSPTPKQFKPYLESGDYGISILLSSVSSVAHAAGNTDFKLSLDSAYYVIFAAFLIAAILMVLPGVPLPLALSGIFILMISILVEPIDFTVGRYWGTPYVVILLSVALGITLLPHISKGAVAALTGLYILIGFGQFIRQESSVVSMIVAAGMVALGIASGILARWRIADSDARQILFRTSRSLIFSGLALLAAILIWPYLMRVIYSAAWNVPYAETVAPNHGSGHPLYVGLGNVPNVYNIAWSDTTGFVHGILVTLETGQPMTEYQTFIKDEWLKIVLESPWVLNDNILHNLGYVVNRFANLSENGLASFGLFVGGIAVLLIILAMVIYHAQVRAGLFYVGWLSVWAGVMLAPAIIRPIGYLSGVVGWMLCACVIVPIAALTLSEKVKTRSQMGLNRQLLVWLYGGMAAAGAAIVILWLIFTAVRWQMYQSTFQTLAESDPVAEIVARGFRYDPYFNSMGLSAQERLIEKMLVSDPRLIIYVPQDTLTHAAQNVVLVAYANSQFHLVLYFPANYPPAINTSHIDEIDLLRLCDVCEGAFTNGVDTSANINLITGLPPTPRTPTYRIVSLPALGIEAGDLPRCLSVLIERRTATEKSTTQQIRVDSTVCQQN